MVQERPKVLGACVQFDVRRGEVNENLAAAERGIHEAAAAGARLLVLPELWSTSLLDGSDDAMMRAVAAADEAVIALSGELDVVIIGSSLERDGRRTYNRALVADNGVCVASYRKMHLFRPLGEHHLLAAGTEPCTVHTSVGHLGIVVCYDLRFPELTRWSFYRGAEILVVPAQWPEARARHWRMLLDARAVENEMFVIGCNRVGKDLLRKDEELSFPGNSRIVDPMGELLAEGQGQVGAVIAELDLRKVHTMRRILPVSRDRQPVVYRRMWQASWEAAEGRRPELSPRTP